MRARALAAVLSLGFFAAGAPASAQILLGGRAYGAFVNADSVLATFVSDTGELPSTGGSLLETATDVQLDNVLRAGFMSTQVYGTGSTSSIAWTTDVSVLPGTPAALTAAYVSAHSIAMCGGYATSFTIENLVFGGVSIPVTSAPNQTVTIPGVATLTINERIGSYGPPASEITANALHLVLATGGEVIVAGTRASVSNCPLAVESVPWSRVKSLYR